MSWFSPSPGVRGFTGKDFVAQVHQGTHIGFQMRKFALLLIKRTKAGVWSRNFHVFKRVTWRNSCWFPFPRAVGDVLGIKTRHSRERQWDKNILDPFVYCTALTNVRNYTRIPEPQSCIQVELILESKNLISRAIISLPIPKNQDILIGTWVKSYRERLEGIFGEEQNFHSHADTPKLKGFAEKMRGEKKIRWWLEGGDNNIMLS